MIISLRWVILMQPSNTLGTGSTSKEGWISKGAGNRRSVEQRQRSHVWQKDACKTFKKQIYKTMVRPAALYGSETWVMKKQHLCKLEGAEMKCLRVIRGVTRRDRMMNEEVPRDVGVMQMRDKMQESRLRWYGHVRRCAWGRRND